MAHYRPARRLSRANSPPSARIHRGGEAHRGAWGDLYRRDHRTVHNRGEVRLSISNKTKIGFDRTIRSEWLDAAAARAVRGELPDEARKFLWDFLEDVEPGTTNNSGRGKTLNRSQIKRRMTETWGDRSTLERTIQHVLRSLAQWGLLRVGEEHGSVIGPAHRIHVSEDVGQLLLHSVLLGQDKGSQFPQLFDHPALFPFAPRLTARTLMTNPVFRVQRQGDQSDFIELA